MASPSSTKSFAEGFHVIQFLWSTTCYTKERICTHVHCKFTNIALMLPRIREAPLNMSRRSFTKQIRLDLVVGRFRSGERTLRMCTTTKYLPELKTAQQRNLWSRHQQQWRQDRCRMRKERVAPTL